MIRLNAQAVQSFQKAAAEGDTDAENRLGLMHEEGTGVQLNYTTAMKWYQKGAAQGNANAELGIGRLYENGDGVPKNNAEAMRWFQKAAQGNDSNARQVAEGALASLKAAGTPQ